MDIFSRSRTLQVIFGGGSVVFRLLTANWTSLVLGSHFNRKGNKKSSYIKKKSLVLGHRKLRESQDVLSNGIWLPFMEQPQLKQKEHTQLTSDI